MSRIFSFYFILSCAIFGIFSTASFAAQPASYLVENVAVSVSGRSPSDARNLATANARRDAFLILLARLDLKLNIADKIDNSEIFEMVRSEQINDEKMAGNNYSASFNIMFAKDFVEHTLAAKNADKIAAIDEKKSEVNLLIPVKIAKRKVVLWEENNDWRAALAKNLQKKSLQNFVIPEADMGNIALLNRDNIDSADYEKLEPILSRSKADAAYILFFVFDEIENKVSVSVSHIRKFQKKQVKLNFVNVDRLSYEALMDKVASKSLDYLVNAQSTDKAVTSSIVRIRIPILSFGNWLMIKGRIESSNLVSQLNIESISKDYALISVNYTSAGSDIVESFAKIGLTLEKVGDNFYAISN